MRRRQDEFILSGFLLQLIAVLFREFIGLLVRHEKADVMNLRPSSLMSD